MTATTPASGDGGLDDLAGLGAEEEHHEARRGVHDDLDDGRHVDVDGARSWRGFADLVERSPDLLAQKVSSSRSGSMRSETALSS